MGIANRQKAIPAAPSTRLFKTPQRHKMNTHKQIIETIATQNSTFF
jgi:hypothetical protein